MYISVSCYGEVSRVSRPTDEIVSATFASQTLELQKIFKGKHLRKAQTRC